MMIRVAANVAALALGGLAAAFVVGPPTVRAQVATIPVTATAVPLHTSDPAVQSVGQLRYLGGLVLRSTDRRFGGLSAVQWEAACNRLLAVSDTGAWVILAPVEPGGRLAGIGETHIASIRNPAGQPPARKAEADAEALSRTTDGDTLVWFERQNLAQRHPRVSACDPSSLNTPASAIITPPDMARWPENGGPEAAAPFDDGQIVFGEDAYGPDGSHQGLVLTAGGETRASVTIALPAGYRPTGLARLDQSSDGQSARYLLLARQFAPLRGVSARVLLIKVPASGGAIVPTEIAHFVPPFTVDNMEGITIRKDGDRTSIYLLSDDNFNRVQRTILLKFQWDEVAEPGG